MSDLQTMKPCPVCGAMLTAALADAIANPGAPESCPTDPATVERARDTVKRAARVLITPTQRVVPLADLSLGGTMSNVSLSPKNVNTVSVNMQSNLDARKIVDAVDWNLRRRA